MFKVTAKSSREQAANKGATEKSSPYLLEVLFVFSASPEKTAAEVGENTLLFT